MRLHVITSRVFAANCVVIVAQHSDRALVVDPSAGIRKEIRTVLEAEGASVAGVLATHGHPDHVWDCAEIASWAGEVPAPVWIPGPDRYRMEDPLAHVGMPAPLELCTWREPSDLRDFPAGSVELVEGLWMKMVPAPGHTEGSSVFIGHCDFEVLAKGRVIASSRVPAPWALAGDVIFAGSVGRTDLPGGDEYQMRHSLRTLSNALDPETLLIPGHGPLTSLAREIETTPYLRRARQIG